MKKKFYLLLLVSVCAINLSAQVENAKEGATTPENLLSRSYKISVGVKGGVNFSTMSGTPDDIELNPKFDIGYHLGVIGNCHFGRRVKDVSPGGTGLFGLQVEALYSQHKAKTDMGNMEVDYFEVPVLLQYYVFPNVNIEVGPTIAGAISSSPDNLSNSNVSYKTGDFKGFDVMLSGGVCYKHKSGFIATARYNYGTSKLAGNFPCKMSVFSVSLGWMFDIVK